MVYLAEGWHVIVEANPPRWPRCSRSKANAAVERSCGRWGPAAPSFAGDRRATPITSASHNRGDLGSRSATSSPSRSVPSTISKTMRLAMSDHGGRNIRSSRSPSQSACGGKANGCEHWCLKIFRGDPLPFIRELMTRSGQGTSQINTLSSRDIDVRCLEVSCLFLGEGQGHYSGRAYPVKPQPSSLSGLLP
jgi:hypothetical protein